jgi:hypothetical protein
VSIDHDCLAVFTKLAALNALSRCTHGDSSKNARTPALTATLVVDLSLVHVYLISCMANDRESTTLASRGAQKRSQAKKLAEI